MAFLIAPEGTNPWVFGKAVGAVMFMLPVVFDSRFPSTSTSTGYTNPLGSFSHLSPLLQPPWAPLKVLLPLVNIDLGPFKWVRDPNITPFTSCSVPTGMKTKPKGLSLLLCFWQWEEGWVTGWDLSLPLMMLLILDGPWRSLKFWRDNCHPSPLGSGARLWVQCSAILHPVL